MRNRVIQRDAIPDFDVVLWGYDPAQVDRCVRDLTDRLEQAFARLDSVNVLHEQLCEARLELDQLRLSVTRRPSFANRLGAVMERAEQLRIRAEQAAQQATGQLPADRSR